MTAHLMGESAEGANVGCFPAQVALGVASSPTSHVLRPYYEDAAAGLTVYHGDCRDVLPLLDAVDHVITDPPFSERTHRGHDASSRGAHGSGFDGANRQALGYVPWTACDAREYVHAVTSICDGWVVTMTDHTLAPSLLDALDKAGRYVFAPLPFFAPGSTVRLSGDGPCSWTTWIVVARTVAQHRWGTLPGGYVAGPGWQTDVERMGGKPLALMKALISDYTRPGDLVLDPFAGSFTTGVACKELGRRFIGIELEQKWCDVGVRRIKNTEYKPPLFRLPPETAEQASLLEEAW